MRVAIWHNLPSGGGKRALYDHVKGLLSLGHYVEVWTPPTSDRSYLPLVDLVKEHVVPLDHRYDASLLEKVQIHLQVKRGLRAMDEHCARCAKEIDANGFDVVFANSCQFYRATPIGLHLRTPAALYLQEPFRWLYEAMPENPWAALIPTKKVSLASLKRRFVDLRSIRNARVQVREEIRNVKAFDLLLCNSLFSRESILRAYGVSAEVCYLGVDTTLFASGDRLPGTHVIGLGAFTREKNVELAVRSIACLPEPRPTLIWVGNTGDPAYLEQVILLAKTLGVNLDVKQRIGDAELLNVLRTAAAMIYVPRLEPFGLAPIEAGACGVPVVAVAEGGVRETVLDGINGLLAPPNPEDIARALALVLGDRELSRALGDAGRSRARSLWSTKAATLRLAEALQSVARVSRPS